MARLLALGVLLCASMVAGLDCEAAHKAMGSTCEIFGSDSQPCHMLRFHHTAKCVGVELGESQQAFPAGGLATALKNEAEAASHGDVMQTIQLANEVYDKAKAMCKCNDKVAAHRSGEPTSRSAVKEMGAQGQLNGAGEKAAKGLSLDAAKGFVQEVRKEESSDGGDTGAKTTTAERKEEKQEEALQAKEKIDAQKAESELAIQRAGAQAAKDGKDPEKVIKKLRQAEKEKMSAAAAALPGSDDDNETARKINEGDVKQEQKDVRAANKAGMMNALPAGMGLRNSFKKVLDQNKSAKKAEKAKVREEEYEERLTKKNEAEVKSLTPQAAAGFVKEEGDKQNDKMRNGPAIPGGGGLSGDSESDSDNELGEAKQADRALEQMEESIEHTSLHQKVAVSTQDSPGLEREEAKVEETAMPAEDGDRVMYGKTASELAGEMISPVGINKQKLAHAAADAKKFAKVAEYDDTVGAAYDGTGYDLVTDLEA